MKVTLKIGDLSQTVKVKSTDDVGELAYIIHGEILKQNLMPELVKSKLKCKLDGESIETKKLLLILKDMLRSGKTDLKKDKKSSSPDNKKSDNCKNKKKKDSSKKNKKPKKKSDELKSSKDDKKKKDKKKDKKKSKKAKTTLNFDHDSNESTNNISDIGRIKLHRIKK